MVPHFGHEFITQEDYDCRLALNKIKLRVLNEMHVFAHLLYDEERTRLLERRISADAAACLKPYSANKSTFDKIRAAVRPANNDFNSFDAPDKNKKTVTVQQKPFLRYDNKSDTSRILIFVSDDALRILGDISRWHSDGEC